MTWWRRLKLFVREALDAETPPRRGSLVVTPDQTRPEPRAAAHVSAAREALLRGDSEACAAAALEALGHDCGSVLALFYLGQARLRQQRFAEARGAFARAVEIGDPFGLSRAWLTRADQLLREPPPGPLPGAFAAMELERAARAALRNAAYDDAARLAGEAIALDASNLLAHHYLGQARLARGDRAGALAAFEAARPYEGGLGLVDQWIDSLDSPLELPWPDPSDE